MPEKKLIINADDLGIAPPVNRAILNAAETGGVTAASLMTNMPFARQAAEEVRRRIPNLSLGLHFCLTSGRPVASPERLSRLVDAEGRFCHHFLGLWRLARSKKREEFLRQVREEFEAQRERMDRWTQEFGLRFDHLDSHQHIHVLPGIREILGEEAERRRQTLRLPHERFGGFRRCGRRFFRWFPAGIAKRFLLNHHLGVAEPVVRYFGILDSGHMDENALDPIIETIVETNEGGFFEVNIHPSEIVAGDFLPEERPDCSAEDERFLLSPWRNREFQAVTDRERLARITGAGIQRTGFPSWHTVAR